MTDISMADISKLEQLNINLIKDYSKPDNSNQENDAALKRKDDFV
jgi:hypothetical protein